MLDVIGLDFYKKEGCFYLRFVIFDIQTKKKSFTLLELNLNFDRDTMTCEFWKKISE